MAEWWSGKHLLCCGYFTAGRFFSPFFFLNSLLWVTARALTVGRVQLHGVHPAAPRLAQHDFRCRERSRALADGRHCWRAFSPLLVLVSGRRSGALLRPRLALLGPFRHASPLERSARTHTHRARERVSALRLNTPRGESAMISPSSTSELSWARDSRCERRISSDQSQIKYETLFMKGLKLRFGSCESAKHTHTHTHPRAPATED